jgi:ABC-type transport system involved in multi-copper enzyme maturation permease subunit
MVWQIVKKEILSNMMTLRFALINVLLSVLMVMNALIYAFGEDGYVSEVNDYRSMVNENALLIKKHGSISLGELAMQGPGDTIPRLSRRFTFCADGNNELMPRRIPLSMEKIGSGGSGYNWTDLWSLSYPPVGDKATSSKLIKLDWVFIGVLLSFGAILFSFDAISEERARGTLCLMLSNSISRGQVLLGKFLGAFLAMLLPLLVAILINLLIINLSGALPLDGADWLRLGGMIYLLAMHLSIFILLGLFVSSRVSRSVTSLAILLLSWVFLAFLFPNLQGLFVSNLRQISSVEEVRLRKNSLLKDIEYKFKGNIGTAFPEERLTVETTPKILSEPPSPENPQMAKKWSEYLTERMEVKTRINNRHLDEQFAQVRLARNVSLVSPIAVFQYAMESLAGTGIEGYMDFVRQVRRYRRDFVNFILSQDRSDASSLHIYGVREGLSQKPVDPEGVPRFQERITYGNALEYMILLILFGSLLFMAVYVSFIRIDVK